MATEKKRLLSTYDIAKELHIPVMTPNQFKRFCIQCWRAGKPVYVQGRPGSGKTDCIHQVAEEVNLWLIVNRLNGKEPTDIGGLPIVYKDNMGVSRHQWTLGQFFWAENQPLPEGYNGICNFWDEVSQGMPQTQNVIRQMVNEHELNGVKQHPDVWHILASNFAADKAATYPVPSHLRRACAIVALVNDKDDFVQYCQEHGIHEDISAFVMWRFVEGSNPLDCFDPDATINCSPAALISLFPFLENGVSGDELADVIYSTIGEGYGAEFLAYMSCKAECVTIEQILAKPDKTPIPDEERCDIMCATAAMVGRALNCENSIPLVKYLTRMPPEYCVFAMRDGARRDPKIKDTKAYRDWVIQHGDVLF